MSEKGQTDAAPARSVETPRQVESQPAMDLSVATSEKFQSDVYKGPSSDNSRVDFNHAVIAASFAPGTPESLREASYVGGDFKSYRAMMDSMWLGANKMPGLEREARFAGVGMLPMPDDKGLQCQSAGQNGSECIYKPSERKDGLAKLVRNRVDGREDVSKEYHGRPDHLLSEKYSAGKNLRGFERMFEAGKGPSGLTSEKYLRTAATESFERVFDPAKNPDKVTLHSLTRKDATETESKSFQGRSDGLKREERITTTGSSSTERLFEPNAANKGLQSDNKWKTTNDSRSIEMKLFDPTMNKDKLQSENITKEDGTVTIQKTFNGRSDGVRKETTEITGNGAISVREMADGTKQQRLLSPEQLKATGADLSGLSTTNEASQRLKKALETNGTHDAKNTKDTKDAKDGKDGKDGKQQTSDDAAVGAALRDILKKTVGENGLNHPSFEAASPPSPRDKAVMLIGASAGYEGLKKAGMTVDENANTATTADGSKYTFEKQQDGRLRTVSLDSEKNNRKVEFLYKQDGAFIGSIESAKLSDRPAGSTNAGGMKYENMELPAIQKGWGPYQALQQMQREGKIQMSPQEMREEAVRIRDREFARLGRNYFKVGETFQMYSPEEMAQKQGPRETTVKVHRDAEGNLQKMERGDGGTVTFTYDAEGKPSRVSDGIGPDLVSRDGGQSWEFESKADAAKADAANTANKGLTPALKGKVTVQTEKGTITVQSDDNLKFTIGADGTRTYTGADGKELTLFQPLRAEAQERRSRGLDRRRTPHKPEGNIPASSEYDEGGRPKRGDATPHQRGRGRPGPDGTIAQTYINQENMDPEMRAVRAPAGGPDGSMRLRGSPSISAEKIDQVLREARSPAAKERIRDAETGKEITFGQHLYKLGVEYGIDPAITLGFFKSESGFGKHGAAARNNSVGNIKGDGGFRQYGSFAEGARDWFKLMQDGKAYLRAGRETVGAILPKYAPASDGNNVGKYIRDVERDVRTWSRASAHAAERNSTPGDVQQGATQETVDRQQTAERMRQQTAERGIPESDRMRELRQLRDRTALPKPDDTGRPIVEVRQGESIQAAIDRAQEGSIIKVYPGVYKERLHIKKDNISLRGDGKAVIDLEGQKTSGGAININNRRGVQIDGFEIRNVKGGDTPTGIQIEGASRDISITNNNVHHIENSKNAHGIVVRGTSAEPMRNIVIANNEVHNLKLGSSESIAINGNVDGFRVINNKVHDNDNIGIDVIGYEGVGRAGIDRARNGIIAGNLVYNIDTKNNPAYRGDRSGAGIYVDGGSDIIIENNTIKNSNYGIELASEHAGKYTTRIQVRRNVVEGSHLAGISLGGGSASNGGVSDSIIENNDFRNNSRPVWRQHHVSSDIVYRNNDGPIAQAIPPVELPQIRRNEDPGRRSEETAQRETLRQLTQNAPMTRVVRDVSDRAKFYAHQDDGHSCSAFSMAMMASDHLKGSPPQYGQETRSFKALAGVLNHGYRGSLETMAGQLRRAGLESKAYQYDRFGPKGMEDLNAELDQGHSAVARVINPHTGNRHYIYVAGRNAEGNYILGDPDRGNPSHKQPVSPQRLMKMMSGRDGFVAGWAPSDSAAASIPGTAAYKRVETCGAG
ncbi:MAG TPA: hypothetical protein EYN91_08920 [Candidatus Melainabacteria bacterium]|nr:hypothetical protein [Candidatus Melainabacteria bacterium]